MELEQCYRVLGVRSDADLSEIKSTFRRLALQYHPDRNKSPEAEAKFNAIADAFGTIVSSQGLDLRRRVGDHKDFFAEDSTAKLTFTILTYKEVVHTVSARLFEREIRRYFNPKTAIGTYCEIGKKSFEIHDQDQGHAPLFRWRSGGRKALIEWDKAPNGTDRWKHVGWDDFWSYVHRYVSSAAMAEDD